MRQLPHIGIVLSLVVFGATYAPPVVRADSLPVSIGILPLVEPGTQQPIRRDPSHSNDAFVLAGERASLQALRRLIQLRILEDPNWRCLRITPFPSEDDGRAGRPASATSTNVLVVEVAAMDAPVGPFPLIGGLSTYFVGLRIEARTGAGVSMETLVSDQVGRSSAGLPLLDMEFAPDDFAATTERLLNENLSKALPGEGWPCKLRAQFELKAGTHLTPALTGTAAFNYNGEEDLLLDREGSFQAQIPLRANVDMSSLRVVHPYHPPSFETWSVGITSATLRLRGEYRTAAEALVFRHIELVQQFSGTLLVHTCIPDQNGWFCGDTTCTVGAAAPVEGYIGVSCPLPIVSIGAAGFPAPGGVFQTTDVSIPLQDGARLSIPQGQAPPKAQPFLSAWESQLELRYSR